jgi:hypothetical protein
MQSAMRSGKRQTKFLHPLQKGKYLSISTVFTWLKEVIPAYSSAKVEEPVTVEKKGYQFQT